MDSAEHEEEEVEEVRNLICLRFNILLDGTKVILMVELSGLPAPDAVQSCKGTCTILVSKLLVLTV